MRANRSERANGGKRFGANTRFAVLIASLAIGVLAACGPRAAPAPPAPPAASGASSACPGPGAPPDAISAALLNATNASRGGAGLGPLSWNGQLWCLASEWSSHLDGINGLEHRDLNATLRSPAYAGYRTVGENVFSGPAGMSGNDMHAAWMGSPLHQANILSPAFSSIGFAYTIVGGQVFATENFGG